MKAELVFEKSFKPSVSSHGYSNASILFLTGFPSKDDLFNGAAISGTGESLLGSFLRMQGLNYKQVYKSCFIKEQLDYSGTNPKRLGFALKKIHTERYQELLFQELKEINPNVVVPLDDIALAAVFPHINQIKKPKGRMYWSYCYRGSILPLREDFQRNLPNVIRVIPTLGSSFLNQDYAARSYVSIDFERIKENSFKRSPIVDPGMIWIAKTYQELSNFFERGMAKNDGFVTFDYETYCGVITCCSFCFDGNEAVSVPLNPYFYPEISRADLALNWILIAKLLNHKIPKCGQNVKYDFTMGERHGFRISSVVHDTMLKQALLYAEFPKGLDFLTSVYTDSPYYKDEGKNFDPTKDNKQRLLLYNAKDALNTHIINKKQEAELIEGKVHSLYYDEIAPLILIYKNIDELGILIDQTQKELLLFKYQNMLQSNLSILRGLINDASFNPSSPTQVGKFIYDELHYPKRTQTNENGIKSYKTDKETLDDLLINFGEQNSKGIVGVKILTRIILCRKLALIINYLNTPLHPDGTFRGVSNLGGTETGRTSFSKSLDEHFYMDYELKERADNRKGFKIQKRLGRSLQTITKHGFTIDNELFDEPGSSEIASDLRSMFVPRKGCIFLEIDGAQAEARVVAVLAEDYDLLESFDRKPSIHAKTAALCFGGDPNEITKDYPRVPKVGMAFYDAGKRIRHAGNYDMGEYRLAQMTHLTMSESRLLLDKFHSGNPKIRGIFHSDVNANVTKNRLLVTPFGRFRNFYDRFSNSLYKVAKAYIPQSTISDQTKFTLPRIIRSLEGYNRKYKVLTEQHDGILFEVKKDYWERLGMKAKEIYERPIDFNVGTLKRDFQLKIPAEVSKSTDNWMNMKELKGFQ